MRGQIVIVAAQARRLCYRVEQELHSPAREKSAWQM